MSRQTPSPAARAVTGHLTGSLGVRTVLDHGDGRGADVAHYRATGLDADGYDPHEGFGWHCAACGSRGMILREVSCSRFRTVSARSDGQDSGCGSSSGRRP
ncbi:hypothetical protein ACWGHM_34515 [Streptomyces sp. NPDC054904]